MENWLWSRQGGLCYPGTPWNWFSLSVLGCRGGDGDRHLLQSLHPAVNWAVQRISGALSPGSFVLQLGLKKYFRNCLLKDHHDDILLICSERCTYYILLIFSTVASLLLHLTTSIQRLILILIWRLHPLSGISSWLTFCTGLNFEMLIAFAIFQYHWPQHHYRLESVHSRGIWENACVCVC